MALTFDDLPLNGTLPDGARQSDFARDTVRVLKKYRIPPSYGFINADKLERNPDGAKALEIWVAGGHPLANHTYSHLDLTRNSAEDFQREILRNERCWMKNDAESIAWLRESYLEAARDFIRLDIANSRAVFGRDIHHVMLLHLGSFSSHILPDLFKLLAAEGLEIVTLEEAQKDPAYEYDPDFADPRGGTLVELAMLAKGIPWPANAPKKPRERLAALCN